MFRLTVLILILCLGHGLFAAPIISAKAAILMDRKTGIVLWEQNADAALPMASTTKIMTAMVILDHGTDKLDQIVTVSKYAASTPGSSLLGEGDMLTLRELLIAALVRSSNEATVAAAEELAGSEQTFVQWMNAKAVALLGPDTKTHFMNPHGLYNPQHVSTARDLAKITRYALSNYPLIRQIIIMGTPKPVFLHSLNRGLIRTEGHNRIINKPVPGVPGSIVDGVKTGYVNESGRCLVSSATLNHWQLISVVLNSDKFFVESQALLNYGFTRFQWKTYVHEDHSDFTAPVAWGVIHSVRIGAKGGLGAPVPQEFGNEPDDRVVFRGEHLSAPLHRGEHIGALDLIRNGRRIATTDAIALDDTPVAWWAKSLAVLGVLALLFSGIVGVGIAYGTVAKNRRRQRRLLAARGRDVNNGRPYHGER